MRPIVFLDMDDVLCVSQEFNSVQVMMCFRENQLDWPELWAGLVDSCAAKNLGLLHDEFTPQYVISSSWATYLDRTKMCDVFTRTQLHFVRENLHAEWMTPRSSSWSRHDEIAAWLEKFNSSCQPFIILDDPGSGWSLEQTLLMTRGHVVLCDEPLGFTTEKLETARKLMRLQLS